MWSGKSASGARKGESVLSGCSENGFLRGLLESKSCRRWRCRRSGRAAL